ncbi:S-adenosyl-L-methionine-dependent methyltransferase, partial [Artomyces pyxidatus]
PTKKRKTGLLGPGNELYDATGLVTYYTEASQVPDHLQKYFSQRTRFFSLYDSGCLLDDEGWYSVTPEAVADQIAERCRCTTILDAFCGVGGNAIAFARTCERVIALDTSPTRLALARHNATVYGVADRIEFILADYLSFARKLASSPSRKIDVVFLSPPWGGPSYLSGVDTQDAPEVTTHPDFSLASVQPVHGKELFDLTRLITPNVAYYLPRNTRIQEISSLLDNVDGVDVEGASTVAGKKRKRDDGGERIEIEEEWMGNKLKALTCYFGGLVEGQEHLF